MGEVELERFRSLVARRAGGEPIAYLTGRREFWSLPLQVTTDTLIPRPETELLVEWALELLPATGHRWVADLGTGSGAIAAALAHERPGIELLASDLSAAALAVAAGNFAALGLDNVRSVCGNWYAALPRALLFDLIISNPPYIANGDPHLQGDGLPCEPAAALSSGSDGLDAIRLIVAQAGDWLVPGGWLLLEHGYDQADAVANLLRYHGFAAVATRHDLAGHPRASGGRRPANERAGRSGSLE